MSGHNKWTKIKFKKNITDNRRSKKWGKILRDINIAVRMHGDNIAGNYKLKQCLETAREANVPKNNISKAMKTYSETNKKLEEGTYEIYGKYGIKILIKYITDNKKRVLHELKLLLHKNNCYLADSKSIAFEFKYVEQVTVYKDNEKELENLIINISCDFNLKNIIEKECLYILICNKDNIWDIIDILKNKDIKYSYFIGMKSMNILEVTGIQLQKCIEIIEKLKDLEDVQDVWNNLPIN